MNNSAAVIFFKWFFVVAPREILQIGRNFLLWAWHYFSIGYFLPRLFSPWHKDISGYGRGFDLKRFLHVWGWNTISRVIGAILRLVVMAIGIVVLAGLFFLTVLAVVAWYALPLLIPFLIAVGLITPLL